MPVYNINGNEANPVYNRNGSATGELYDVSGREIDDYLTVMTYNYQWCNPINTLAYQQEILAFYKPDIIGIQEAGRRGIKEFPTTAQASLASYPYKYLSDYYNYNALASKIELISVSDNPFSAQAGSETFTYQKCYIIIGAKKIAWYNTHLHFDDKSTSVRSAQAQEILADAENEEYAIITGDFNCYGLTLDSAEYIGIGKPYADAGYNLANWTAENYVKTWTDLTDATSLNEFEYACDNIIVSSNIDIVSTTFDTIKLNYKDGSHSIDHVPVIARLKIN